MYTSTKVFMIMSMLVSTRVCIPMHSETGALNFTLILKIHKHASTHGI